MDFHEINNKMILTSICTHELGKKSNFLGCFPCVDIAELRKFSRRVSPATATDVAMLSSCNGRQNVFLLKTDELAWLCS